MVDGSSATTLNMYDFATGHLDEHPSPPPIPARSPLRNSMLIENENKDQQCDAGCDNGCDTPAMERYIAPDQQIDETLRELNARWPYEHSRPASTRAESTHSQASSTSRYSTASSMSVRSDKYSSSEDSPSSRALSMSSFTSIAQLTTGSSRSDNSSYWDEYLRPPSFEKPEPAFTFSIPEPEVSTDQIFDLVYDIPAVPYEKLKAQHRPELLFPPHPAVRLTSVTQRPEAIRIPAEARASTVPLVLKSVTGPVALLRQLTRRDVKKAPQLDCIPTRTSSRRSRYRV